MSEYYIAHYGIDGMKWGVRRYQNADGSYTAAGKARYGFGDGKTYSGVVNARGKSLSKKEQKQLINDALSNLDKKNPKMHAEYQKKNDVRGLSKKDYEGLDDKDVKVNKGSEVYRFKIQGDNTQRPATYVSTNREDADQYRAILPINYAGAKFEEVSYKTASELVSPSTKKRVDTWIDQIANDKATRDYVANTLGYGKEAYSKNAMEVGLKSYKRFIANQGNMNEKINSKYFKTLQDKGYNAIVDDQDQGVLSSMPMAVLNKNALQVERTVKLDDNDLAFAATKYKAPDELKKKRMI